MGDIQNVGWSDFAFRSRLKVERGGIHLNFRLSGCSRYFIGVYEGGITLSKTSPCDNHTELLSVDATIVSGQWHDVEIGDKDGQITVSVDAATVLEFVDADPVLTGGIAFETLDDSSIFIDAVTVTGQLPPDLGLKWIRTGGPMGGLGYDVRIRVDDPKVLFVSDAFSGVHKSMDGGNTWHAANVGITTRVGESGDAIPIFSLYLDPNDPETIWAGTQNLRGIFRSTDGGLTWEEKTNGISESFGIAFRGFAVSPTDSNVVYAAAELASWVWAGEERMGREFDLTAGVIYKTVDGGERWSAIWRGDSLARYIWIDPTDTEVVYISTGIFDREAANSESDPRGGGEGVLKSMDGGETWASKNDGIGNLYVGSLFMHPDNPENLIAGAGNVQYPEGSGVYISLDGAETWRRTLAEPLITSVEFVASNPDVAYAASLTAVFRSDDRGRTWRRVSGPLDSWGPPGIMAGFPIDLQVSPDDPDKLFANNYGGGNFLSTDGGRTWITASSGYTGAQARDIAVHPTMPNSVIVAARSGLFCSGNWGAEWVGLNNPPGDALEWNAIAIDPSDPYHLVASNNMAQKILQSWDRGASWQVSGPHLNRTVGWRVVSFAPSDSEIVYAGTGAWTSAGSFDPNLDAQGIYRSGDSGKTWTDANDSNSRNAHVAEVAIASADSNLVYAATTNHGVLLTRDSGESWTLINEGLPIAFRAGSQAPAALSVATHPLDARRVWVGLLNAGLYYSANAGETWNAAVRGLESGGNISDIVFDPTDPSLMYVADRRSGVYRSDDGARSWTQINDGLRTRDVQALAISSDGGTLYAATEGEGVFRLQTASSGDAD